MVAKLEKALLVSFLFFLCIVLFNPSAQCQQAASIQKGVDQYKAENYEEAIEILIKAREEDPKSSVAAFFLGLSYKQTMEGIGESQRCGYLGSQD
ncbi:MAG: hypothetical protein JRJ02_03220 [Deltaproteobacteria bacterium]|nr:hypothetical protein [Deltaproteobacteria bacterium]